MGLDIYLQCKIQCPKCGNVIDFDENVYELSNNWKEEDYQENEYYLICPKCKSKIAKLNISV